MFSPDLFYGGSTKKFFLQQLRKRQKREEREKGYKARPLSNINPYVKVFSERIVWKWFTRQQEALDYCQCMKENCLRLFAYEKLDGKRKYLVTTLKQFWFKYVVMDPEKRHFYEVISMHTPCQLYFDIEYQKDLNSELIGADVLDVFIYYVCYCLYKEFNIACDRSQIIDLVSSSDSKFSRHLIFHLEGYRFINNINCGEFVKEICFALKSFIETGESRKYFPISNCSQDSIAYDYLTIKKLQSLLVIGSNGTTFLCDLGVYTKNRNFRLYLSSKASKGIPLVFAAENRFQFTRDLTQSERLKYRIKNEIFDPDLQMFVDTLVCPDDGSTSNSLLKYGGGLSSNANISVGQKLRSKPQKEGHQSTPFPDLDRFVMNHVRKNCGRGIIRRWLLFQESKVLIYDIDQNRWCGNVRREHKSNHIYYVADLKFKVLYQKCHDPDCANFHSTEIVIPDEVNPMVETEEIEEFDVSQDPELSQLFNDDLNIDEMINSSKLNKHKKGDALKMMQNQFDPEVEMLDDDFDFNNDLNLDEKLFTHDQVQGNCDDYSDMGNQLTDQCEAKIHDSKADSTIDLLSVSSSSLLFKNDQPSSPPSSPPLLSRTSLQDGGLQRKDMNQLKSDRNSSSSGISKSELDSVILNDIFSNEITDSELSFIL